MLRWTLLLYLLCIALPARAEIRLPEFTAYYDLYRGVIHFGQTRRTLSHNDDGSFTYESETRPNKVFSLLARGHIIERSRWIVHENRVRPLEYSYLRSDGQTERDVTLNFDWDKFLVTNTINNDPWQMPIPGNALDKLIYQIALMVDLQQGLTEFNYEIADGGKLKQYTIQALGEAHIDTPLGRLKTIKVQRVGDKRNTTMWCAPRLNYLPVRIEQEEENGRRIKAQLSLIKGLTVQLENEQDAAPTELSTGDATQPGHPDAE